MTQDSNQQSQIAQAWQWLKKPPQVYVFYLVCLLLVWLVSFYAGTLNPKRGTGFGPAPVSTPVAPPLSGAKN